MTTPGCGSQRCGPLARLPGGFGPDDTTTDLRTADPDALVRAAATVARAGQDPHAALALVDDRSDAVRAAAVASLGTAPLDDDTRAAAITALGDASGPVRDAAATVLAADDGPVDDVVAIAVTGPVLASRPALRALAIRAERLGHEDSVRTPVLAFALDRVGRRRCCAASARHSRWRLTWRRTTRSSFWRTRSPIGSETSCPPGSVRWPSSERPRHPG